MVGYQSAHWGITSGISLLRTGFKEDSAIGGNPTPLSYFFKEYQYYYHFLVPLMVTYKFNVNNRFFLAPAVGGEFSYNTSSQIVTHPFDDAHFPIWPARNVTLSDSVFNSRYKRTNLWGTVQVEAGYKLNDRLNIVCGPEAQFMITPIGGNQKNHAYTINAGITWNLANNTQFPGENTLKTKE